MYNYDLARSRIAAAAATSGNSTKLHSGLVEPFLGGPLAFCDDPEIKEQAEEIALLYYIVYNSLAGYDRTGDFEAKLNNTFLWDYDSMHNKVRKAGFI